MVNKRWLAGPIVGGLFLAAMGSPGCISRTEGCLDPGASNYDLEAERSCPDCCTYPTVNLEWSPKWGADNFSTSDTFADVAGRPYLIRDIRFLLESWTWTDAEGMLYSVDSSVIACSGAEITWAADHVQVIPTQFVYPIGTVRAFPQMTALRFAAGPTRDYTCLDPDDSATPDFLTADGPLWDPKTETLSTLRLVLQTDLAAPQTDTLYFHDLLTVELPYALAFERGRSPRFRLTADYSQWFAAADITDLATFHASWIAGVAGSVSLTP